MINFFENTIAFFFPNYYRHKEFDNDYRELINFIKNPNLETQQKACKAVCSISCQTIPVNKKDDTIEALLSFIEMTSVLLQSGILSNFLMQENGIIAIGAAIRKILLNVSQDQIPHTCGMIFSFRNDSNKNTINLEVSKIIRQLFSNVALSNDDIDKYKDLSNALFNIFDDISVEKLEDNKQNTNYSGADLPRYGAIAVNALLAWTLLDHNDKSIVHWNQEDHALEHYATKQQFFEMLFDKYPIWFCRLFVSRIKRESIASCKEILEQQGFNEMNINLLYKLMFLNTIVAIYNEKNDEN